ncbi:hypothetical protein [Synechococcus sp. BO 8801]|uniref:hypothetical protein n=1 Tax=Synechococcus sp. BO 8801 TaxID=169670 RepID=UPI001180F4C5|nr:hypothetical protein [Synechococcus sp. BO 8801]
MAETGEASIEGLVGDKLYQQRARAALPILVRQAKASQTIEYGALSRELGMPNPRNLNYVLGAIGNSMLELGQEWGIKVPPIQALVVNKGSGLPGEGISWFAPDASEFKKASRINKELIVNGMLAEVFTFARWNDVLARYGLKPVTAAELIPVDPSQITQMRDQGEGEQHLALKLAISLNPSLVGIEPSLGLGDTEVDLYSGDRVDVHFASLSYRIAVEVKPVNAPQYDVVRGLFQCIKYLAVIEAEEKAEQSIRDCRVILALGGDMPGELRPLQATLGIHVIDRLGLGEV